MANFYVGEVLFETGGTIDTPGDINVTAICDCTGSVGTAGQLLSSTGAALQWTTAGAAGIPCSILTAKGDIVVATGASTPAALPVGTDGQLLYACSTATTGLCWAAPPAATSAATPAARGIVYGCTTDAHPVSGTGDVALGLNAYAAVTTGYSNTAIGGDALGALTSGCNNVGIGDQAGFAITTESDNVVIGANSIINGSLSKSVLVGSSIEFLSGNLENVIVGHLATNSSNIGTSISCSVVLGACALTNTMYVGDNLIALGHGITLPSNNGNTQLAIGNGSTYWLSGNSNYAIKPGAGIIDCANSCGTAGQVLMSTGTNKICWGTAGGGGASPATPSVSGTVFGCANTTNAAIGSGVFAARTTGACNSALGISAFPALTTGCYNIALGDSGGSTITTGCYNVTIGSGVTVPNATGSCQLAIGAQSGSLWLTGNSTLAIKPGAGIIDCAGSCGSAGQTLTSNGSNAIVWATPPTVYQTTSTAPYTFSAGVPVNILNFGDSNSVIDMTLFTTPQGTVSVVWKAVKAGDPTNYNTGWNPYFSWPVPSIYNPGSFTMLSPVYPDPLAGNMILEYTPAANFTSPFTLVYAAMLGAAPTWMI